MGTIYLAFHRKRLEPRVLPWHQHSRYHSVSFVMYISGAKFEEHCCNISGDTTETQIQRQAWRLTSAANVYDFGHVVLFLTRKR